MKRTFLSLVVILFYYGSMAQQDFYIFIQETSRQPFYVRIGEESRSSSAGGHIILSPLKDTVYSLFIGFPKSRYPEQLFTVAINRKDRGYELRNMEGSWQLFDLQSLQLIKPVAAQQTNVPETKRTDSYSELMAGVVDDTAVLYTSVAEVEAVKNEPVKNVGAEKKETQKDGGVPGGEPQKKEAVKKKLAKSGAGKKGEGVIKVDSVKKEIAIKTEPAKEEEKLATEDTATNTAEAKKAVVVNDSASEVPSGVISVRDKRDIIRLSTENIVEGKLVIYLDRTGVVTDTIRIIIPRL